MKIGIDISQIVYQTGVSTYTRNLVKNLLAVDGKNEYLLFGGSLRRREDLSKFTDSLKGNYQAKIYPWPPSAADLVWNRLHFFKIENFVGKVDIFHSSDWAQPPSRALKVTTVHDLSPLRYPKLTHPKIVSVYNANLKWIIKEVDRIIVPSQATKDDLTALKVKRNNITVIPEAPDPDFKKAKDSGVKETKKNYQINKYLLAIGTAKRKNIGRIVKAFEKINQNQELQLIMKEV